MTKPRRSAPASPVESSAPRKAPSGKARTPADRAGQVDQVDQARGGKSGALVSAGQRLRFLRELHGLSQRELARRSGLTHATIGGIERDAISPSIGSMLKIVDSFPITMSEFFSLDPSSDTQAIFRAAEMRESGSGGISVRQVGGDLKGRPLQ
ncbi:MAG: helix-turn-helix domain-containing protein, partial [Rubrivivax sp.]